MTLVKNIYYIIKLIMLKAAKILHFWLLLHYLVLHTSLPFKWINFNLFSPRWSWKITLFSLTSQCDLKQLANHKCYNFFCSLWLIISEYSAFTRCTIGVQYSYNIKATTAGNAAKIKILVLRTCNILSTALIMLPTTQNFGLRKTATVPHQVYSTLCFHYWCKRSSLSSYGRMVYFSAREARCLHRSYFVVNPWRTTKKNLIGSQWCITKKCMGA